MRLQRMPFRCIVTGAFDMRRHGKGVVAALPFRCIVTGTVDMRRHGKDVVAAFNCGRWAI